MVVELTRVDDESCSAADCHASDLSIQDDVGGSVRLQLRRAGQNDETKHLRVDASTSAPEYRTFDSDEAMCSEGFQEAGRICRSETGEGSFRRKRSPTSVARNCRRTVSRRRQGDSLSVASGSMRSYGSVGVSFGSVGVVVWDPFVKVGVLCGGLMEVPVPRRHLTMIVVANLPLVVVVNTCERRRCWLLWSCASSWSNCRKVFWRS